MGRWLLPRGELTRDQLSSLLLVYVANAADIMGKLSTDTCVICTLLSALWKEALTMKNKVSFLKLMTQGLDFLALINLYVNVSTIHSDHLRNKEKLFCYVNNRSVFYYFC